MINNHMALTSRGSFSVFSISPRFLPFPAVVGKTGDYNQRGRKAIKERHLPWFHTEDVQHTKMHKRKDNTHLKQQWVTMLTYVGLGANQFHVSNILIIYQYGYLLNHNTYRQASYIFLQVYCDPEKLKIVSYVFHSADILFGRKRLSHPNHKVYLQCVVFLCLYADFTK